MSRTSSEIPLQTHHIGRQFGQKTILSGISLSLTAGRVCALLGVNGAGKTTLLKLLMGLIEPTIGHSRLWGTSSWPAVHNQLRRVGCLLDRFEPFDAMPISELVPLSQALGPHFDVDRLKALLSSKQVQGTCRWGRLSKGQKRWVLLSHLLCRGCELLLLDEPADGLDPQSRIDLYKLIRQEANNRNVAALIATHVIHDVERVADEVCILHQGQILLHADLEELREQITVITCSEPPTQLPQGVHVLHVSSGPLCEVCLRETSGKLAPIPGELERRRIGLEDLFLLLTRPSAATSDTAPVLE